ncbi:carbohydrate ABC transporter permease [Paenibacillus thalictri]|uniref:Carbohydrate ABC transporter permease n=2 Tax=Paenibacillus thalictri TaxID=2527873 RepID=A0A4Q9E0D0_9BACL|nr:carbohydrate ABC transporter permease [Paenibacillus thalictri]TBL81890.1 carbohydrate ABC transporter permease [Paenibacillus thalictri]
MLNRPAAIRAVVYHLFVWITAFLMLYPLLWLLSSSLKDNSEIFTHAHQLTPSFIKFENYVTGWQGFGGIKFSTYFLNSLIITVCATVGCVISSTLVAYGFGRIRFAGSRFLFVCMLITMMLPGQVLIIPQYIFFQKIGWVNTFLPLIVPSLFGLPFLIFMIMQFVRGLPNELDESAKIDGCGRYAIFYRIIVPLVTPAVISATIFKFYWVWDDFFGPLIYLNRPRLYPVSLALKFFADPQQKTDWGAMFAMSILSLVPVFAVFLAFQKYIVEGISTTGLKG